MPDCCCGTPSPGYRPPDGKKLTWGMWRYLIRPDVLTEFREVQHQLDEVNRRLDEMGAKTDAANAEFQKDLGRLIDLVHAHEASEAAKDAEIAELRAELDQAAADKAAAVASTEDRLDSETADLLNQADSIIEAVAPEPVEEPPAGDGGPVSEPAPDQPAPVDEGSDDDGSDVPPAA